jgi:hypothetical protein
MMMHQGELFEQFSLLFYYFGLFWFVYSTHTYSTYMTYILYRGVTFLKGTNPPGN